MTDTVTQTNELLGFLPYQMGFVPRDTAVLAAYKDGTFHGGRALALIEPGEVLQQALARAVKLFTDEGVTAMIVIGYGPAAAVTPMVDAVRYAMATAGIFVRDAVRVTDGFWSSYITCPRSSCSAVQGHPYRPQDTVAAAEAILSGRVALPSRTDHALRVASVTGPAAAEMRTATGRAQGAVYTMAVSGDTDADMLAEGRRVLGDVLDRFGAGTALCADEVAYLTVLLGLAAVRDAAIYDLCERVTTDTGFHVEAWADVVRRARPGHVAPAATVLALAAYCDGQSVLSQFALARALDDDPGYTLAQLFTAMFATGVRPAAVAAGLNDTTVQTQAIDTSR